jgi:hypothetical protein
MTSDEFRSIALALPETSENAHMNHPDFRVRGKIFATLGHPQKDRAMVKLTPAQQKRWVKEAPEIFVPVKGGWGRQGCTNVMLATADSGTVREAMIAAWRNAAPKSLSDEFENAD